MTTIDPLTSPIDSIRDWLAERAGYEHFFQLIGGGTWLNPPVAGRDPERLIVEHPFPPTLDGAASAMPGGWMWTRVWVGLRLYWEAKHDMYHHALRPHLCAEVPDTGDEIADRFRLAAACILAEEQANA